MRNLKKHAFFFRAAEKLCASLAAALLVFLLIPAAAFADDPDGELLREVIRAGITGESCPLPEDFSLGGFAGFSGFTGFAGLGAGALTGGGVYAPSS